MVHGVLLVHKDCGLTSHRLVQKLRGVFGQKNVGHAGTLDPEAEGLMLILLGQGTKLSNYLLTNNKSYHFVFQLGVRTDTLDQTGRVLSRSEVSLTEKQIHQRLLKSTGMLNLKVPLYSAVKIKGKKLYQYTRKNQEIEAPFRKMFFYDLKVKNINKDKVEVELSCSKGSYIRSWVEHVGGLCGSGASLQKLVRLKSEPFELSDALNLNDVENKTKDLPRPLNSDICLQKLKPAFLDLASALPHIKNISVSASEQRGLRQGQKTKTLFSALHQTQKEVNLKKQPLTLKITCQSQLVALLELKPFKSPYILRVFPPV